MINKYADDSLALHTDAYELNMIETYWRKGLPIGMQSLKFIFAICRFKTGMPFMPDWNV